MDLSADLKHIISYNVCYIRRRYTFFLPEYKNSRCYLFEKKLNIKKCKLKNLVIIQLFKLQQMLMTHKSQTDELKMQQNKKCTKALCCLFNLIKLFN
jgi:hypothetical protein